MKKTVMAAMVLALVFGLGSAATAGGDGAVINVPADYSTIQAAVDAASDGDQIRVDEGVYAEQVEIREFTNLKLLGDGATITVPDAGMTGQLVKVVDCTNVTIEGFTIDGADGSGVSYGAKNAGGDADTRFMGVFFVNSSGKLLDNVIEDMGWGNGVQQGLGVYALITDDTSRDITIRDNLVTNFQKNGITVWGPWKCIIHDNDVVGWGDTDVIAQNCMQLGGSDDFTASVQGNLVADSNYTKPGWAATGILVYGGNDNVRIVNNEIDDTMVGVYVYPGSTACKIINNSGSGNSWDFYSYEDDTKAHANKFE